MIQQLKQELDIKEKTSDTKKEVSIMEWSEKKGDEKENQCDQIEMKSLNDQVKALTLVNQRLQ